jgi:predicted esterase
LAYGFQIF